MVLIDTECGELHTKQHDFSVRYKNILYMGMSAMNHDLGQCDFFCKQPKFFCVSCIYMRNVTYFCRKCAYTAYSCCHFKVFMMFCTDIHIFSVSASYICIKQRYFYQLSLISIVSSYHSTQLS